MGSVETVTLSLLTKGGIWSPSSFDPTVTAVTCVLQPREVKAEQPAQQNHWARNLKIGAAAVAGGTLLAVTGLLLCVIMLHQHTASPTRGICACIMIPTDNVQHQCAAGVAWASLAMNTYVQCDML